MFSPWIPTVERCFSEFQIPKKITICAGKLCPSSRCYRLEVRLTTYERDRRYSGFSSHAQPCFLFKLLLLACLEHGDPLLRECLGWSLITVSRFKREGLQSFASCFFTPHVIVPPPLLPLLSLPLLRTLTSLAPLNTAIMRWPGADAVDLYTVSCEWAAPICRSHRILVCAVGSLLLLLVKLRALDSELQFNSQDFSFFFFGPPIGADAKQLWGSTFVGGSAVSHLFTFLAVLRQCSPQSGMCWLWHHLAETRGQCVTGGLRYWPLHRNHMNEDIYSPNES